MRPPSQLDGYKAAGIVINDFADVAEKNLPKRNGKNYRRKAAFKQGYYEGLAFACSMLALGEFPASNIATIRNALLK